MLVNMDTIEFQRLSATGPFLWLTHSLPPGRLSIICPREELHLL